MTQQTWKFVFFIKEKMPLLRIKETILTDINYRSNAGMTQFRGKQYSEWKYRTDNGTTITGYSLYLYDLPFDKVIDYF